MVGGTGLYLRAALADLDLRPPVSPEIREEVERELPSGDRRRFMPSSTPSMQPESTRMTASESPA